MHRLPICVSLLLMGMATRLGAGAKESIAGVKDNSFCSEFAHLSLCQLRRMLSQIGPIFDLAIGEIDFLAGGGMAGNGAINGEEDEGSSDIHKRNGMPRSLAGAPMLVRLASRGVRPTTTAGSKVRAAGSGALLGGPLRQSPPGQPRPSIYRLIRLPTGMSQQQPTMSGPTQMSQASQLLRQLWT